MGRWNSADNYDLRLDSSGNITFSGGGGNYIRYNNDSGNRRDLINHVYWNERTGEIYYVDPDSNKYTKLDTSGLDTSGGWLSYASDGLLDTVADAIADIINTNRNKATLELNNQNYQNSMSALGPGAITSIQVPVYGLNVSLEQKTEYAKRKLKANEALKKLLVPDYGTTTSDDDTVYYKYGSNEIDLKYYLHNLGTNLQKYIESKGWNSTEKDLFIQTYNQYKSGLEDQLSSNSGRFITDDAGIITDKHNLLNPKQKVIIGGDGLLYHSIDEISSKSAKKHAKVFSPGLEVQEYLSTIGSAIIGSGKTRKVSTANTGNFDLSKSGFLNYWLNKTNPAGGDPDISAYLALDPVGPNGKRERVNRLKYLSYELSNYLNNIRNSKYDFSSTPFKDKETYMAKINQAITNLNNGWDDTDSAYLQEIGITPEFYTAFMTEDLNPFMTEQLKVLELTKQKAEAESEYISQIKDAYEKFAESLHIFTKDNAVPFVSDARYDNNNPGASLAIGSALENLGFAVTEDNIANIVDVLWNNVKIALRRGSNLLLTSAGEKKLSDILPILLPMYLNSDVFKTSSSGVKFLDEPDEDIKNGAILCYEDGKLFYKFIGDVPECTAWARLEEKFNKNYMPLDNTGKPKYSFRKEGGVIKMMLEGGTAEAPEFNADNMDEETLAQLQLLLQSTSLASGTSTDAKTAGSFTVLSGQSPGQALAQSLFGERRAVAQSKGMSYNQYNAKLRKMNAAPDFYNKDNGEWKTEDYLRLGAIAADIASLIMDPVTGAVTNLGSTATNFLADWADNSVTTGEMWKNLAMNVGMDALSLVPIVGDAAGTGGKLVKSVKNIAPKLMHILTAYGILGTLKNGQNIVESMKKVMSDEKLTVGDWQNIAQAITAVAGVNGYVKAGTAKKLAKNQSLQTDQVGIALRRKNAGAGEAAQDFIFLGEKAKRIRELAQNNDAEGINNLLAETLDFKDYVVNTSVSSKPVKLSLPITRTKNADGSTSISGQSPISVRRVVDVFDIFDPKTIRGTSYRSRNLLNTKRLDAVINGDSPTHRRVFGDDDLITLALADDLFNRHIDDLIADAVHEKAGRLLEITDINQKLNGVTDETGTIVDSGLIKKLQETLANLDNIRLELDLMRQTASDLRTKYSAPSGSSAPLADIIGNASVGRYKDVSRALTRLDAITTKKADINHEISIARQKVAAAEQAEISAKTKHQQTLAQARKKNANQQLKDLIKLRDKLTTEETKLNEWISDYNEAKRLDEGFSSNPNSQASLELKFSNELASYDSDINDLRTRLTELENYSNGTLETLELLKVRTALEDPDGISYAGGRIRTIDDSLRQTIMSKILKQGGIVKASNGTSVPEFDGSYIDLSATTTTSGSYTDTEDPQYITQPTSIGESELLDILENKNTLRTDLIKRVLPNMTAFTRYLLLDRANTINAKKAMKAETPFYLTVKTDYTMVRGDLPAEMQALQVYAKATRPAETALTSDGSLLLAYKAQAHLNGLAAMLQLMDLSNKAYRASLELDRVLRKENHNVEHLVGELNRLAGIKSAQNKEKIRSALHSLRANDRDIFLQGIENDYKTKLKEQRLVQDAATQSRLKLAVLNNPNKYGANLSGEELMLYRKIRAGVSPSSLSTEDQQKLVLINSKVSLAILNQYYGYKGVTNDKWTLDANRGFSSPNLSQFSAIISDPISAKSGTKLEIAKLRDKAKDSDRFAKSVQKQLNSLDKKLDRISKSMYGLPKSEMVKTK